MNRTISPLTAVSLAFFIVGCATPAPQRLDMTQLPMYGAPEIPRPPELQAADEAFIERVAKDFGSRAEASKLWVDQGFKFYNQNNFDLAMKRFNQAWLLDPDQPQVYWGFASVLNDREKFCEGRKMIEKALELGLGNSNPGALADAGRLYTLCAVSDPSIDADTKAAYIKKAYNLYVDASLQSPNLAYVYESWAVSSYWMGNYPEAWKMLEKAKSLGSVPGEKFLNMLKSKMPEPQD